MKLVCLNRIEIQKIGVLEFIIIIETKEVKEVFFVVVKQLKYFKKKPSEENVYKKIRPPCLTNQKSAGGGNRNTKNLFNKRDKINT